MAGIKIGDLPELNTDPQDNDYLVVVDTSVDTTKKLSLSRLITLASIFDSAEATSLIDSDYVQARQSFDAAETISLLSTTGVQSIIPAVDSAYDLGSPTNKWKDLYLSGSSLYLDNQILTKNKLLKINSVLTNDYVSVKEFGATGDGTTDDTSAFIAAVASGAKSIYIPSGRYKISSTVTVNRDITMFGDGPNTIIDLTDFSLTTPDTNAFEFVGGGATRLEEPTVDILAGERRYTFASADHGIEIRGMVGIWDSNEGSFNDRRANYYKGEFLDVMDVDGATVSFYSGFYDNYPANTARFYKADTIQVALRDFNVIADSASAFSALTLEYVRDSIINNVHLKTSNAYANIFFKRVFNCSVTDCTSHISHVEDPTASNMYPIIVANSQNVKVTNSSFASRWHGFASGGDATDLSIPCRELLVDNCVLQSQNGNFPGDFHGNVEFSTFSNCVFRGSGATMGAGHNTFIGNKVTDIVRDLGVGDESGEGPDSDYKQSLGFYSSEATSWNFVISDNIVEKHGSYLRTGFGKFVHITKIPRQSEPSNLIISNNSYINTAPVVPVADPIIFLVDGDPDMKDSDADSDLDLNLANFMIDGNTFKTEAPASGAHSILIRANIDNNGAPDQNLNYRFGKVSITNNILDKMDLDLEHIRETIICGNTLDGGLQGITLTHYDNATIKDNIIKNQAASSLTVTEGNGDYTIISDNTFLNSWSTLTPPADEGSTSTDIFLSTQDQEVSGSSMKYTRFSNNYIRTNGLANRAVTVNYVYDFHEYGNYYAGPIPVGGTYLSHYVADSSQRTLGLISPTQGEVWHWGTTQTDFAKINFPVEGDQSVLVKMLLSNTIQSRSGTVEFTLECPDSDLISTVGFTHTMDSSPIDTGNLIINIDQPNNEVILSLDGDLNESSLHAKVDLIKSATQSSLRFTDITWLN